MKKEIEQIIKKAERSLKVSEKLFEDDDYDFAVSRAYYSMFYMATAVLISKGLTFSKHKGVILGFNQHFVKEGIFEQKYFQMFRSAYDNRNTSDYSFDETFISNELAKDTVNSAKEFFEVIKKYLGEQK